MTADNEMSVCVGDIVKLKRMDANDERFADDDEGIADDAELTYIVSWRRLDRVTLRHRDGMGPIAMQRVSVHDVEVIAERLA